MTDGIASIHKLNKVSFDSLQTLNSQICFPALLQIHEYRRIHYILVHCFSQKVTVRLVSHSQTLPAYIPLADVGGKGLAT